MAEADPEVRTIAPRSPISRARMALLFGVMLTTASGNTAIQSVMPSIGTALGVADVWISLAFSWSASLWVISAPLWARRSDRRGRKAMMMTGLFGFSASMAACGLVLWFGLGGFLTAMAALLLFAAARTLYGAIGSAAPPAVQAYVASRTAREDRTKVLSLLASSFGLGTIVGPALAPLFILPGLGLVGPFAVFCAIGLVAIGVLRFLLPNDEPQFAVRGKTFDAPYGAGEGSGPHIEPEETAEPARLRWRDPRVRPWVTIGLLGGHAQAMTIGVVGFLVLDRLDLRGDPIAGAAPVGLVMMCGAFATLLSQWGLIPTLKLGPRTASLSGVAIAACGIVLFGLGQDLHMIALGFAVSTLGFGLFRPGFTAGTSLAVSMEEQGQASGVVTAVNGAAWVFAPATGVWLYNHSDWLGFAVIVALCLAVIAYGWRALERDTVLTGGNA
jgi:MFS family permease